MNELNHTFFKSEEEDRSKNNGKLNGGILKVTGNNFNRLIYNLHDGYEQPAPKDYNFILIVCNNVDKKSEKMCQHAMRFLNFLREHYKGEIEEIRIGIFNHELNEHPMIEKRNIENFPSIIFFGKKNQKINRGKIFKGNLKVDKLMEWLNKRLSENDGQSIEMEAKHFQDLLLLLAKDDKERKKLAKLLKKANKKKKQKENEVDSGL
jgi:hypothetical protein